MKSIAELSQNQNTQTEIVKPIIQHLNTCLSSAEINIFFNLCYQQNSHHVYEWSIQTGNIAYESPAIARIRQLLLLLQKKNLVQFEEKRDEHLDTSNFMIRALDETALLDALTPNLMQECESMPAASMYIMRIDERDLCIFYQQAHLNCDEATPYGEVCEIQEHAPINYLTVPDLELATAPNASADEAQSILAFVNSHKEAKLGVIQTKLNQLCNLDEPLQFKLWLQSSNTTYPLDVRVFVKNDDARSYNIEKKLAGLMIQKAGEVEIKTVPDGKFFIVKSIRESYLDAYLQQYQIDSEQTDLLKAIRLLRAASPNDPVIEDLAIYDGHLLSSTRNYSHIRSRNHWNLGELQSAINFLRPLQAEQGITVSYRPLESKENDEDRQAYAALSTFNSNQYQIVIDLKNLSQLEQTLRKNHYQDQSQFKNFI